MQAATASSMSQVLLSMAMSITCQSPRRYGVKPDRESNSEGAGLANVMALSAAAPSNRPVRKSASVDREDIS
jgi:hypothetical protein